MIQSLLKSEWDEGLGGEGWHQQLERHVYLWEAGSLNQGESTLTPAVAKVSLFKNQDVWSSFSSLPAQKICCEMQQSGVSWRL